MTSKNYKKQISRTRLETALIQDRWKIQLISLALILSIIFCKTLLLVVFSAGLIHYYSLYLTKEPMDEYLDGNRDESDNLDKRIDYANFAVNLHIIGIYIALIGKIL